MAFTTLVNTKWSARLNYNLHKNLVFANLANSDYEGDAANANVVKINTIGNFTISDYSQTTGISGSLLEDLTSTAIDLNIDQQKAFNFKVEDITKYQSNIALIDSAMQIAAYNLADTVDSYIVSQIVAGTSGAMILSGSTSTSSSYGIATGSAAYEQICDLGATLDTANVPKTGRWVVVPPTFLACLQKDTRFSFQPQVVDGGLVQGQQIGGMQVFVSNNLTTAATGVTKVIAGHSVSIAFASGLRSMESYRPQLFFADAVKGLYVYGAKVLKPTGLAILYTSFK